jgi:hypothetical protein
LIRSNLFNGDLVRLQRGHGREHEVVERGTRHDDIGIRLQLYGEFVVLKVVEQVEVEIEVVIVQDLKEVAVREEGVVTEVGGNAVSAQKVGQKAV